MNFKEYFKEYIEDPNVLNFYIFGSHVYGTNRPDSDIDAIMVVKEPIQSPSVDLHVFTVQQFQYALNYHDIQALECYYLPEEYILKQEYEFKFELNLQQLRESISTVASNSWVKGKKKLTVSADYNKKLAIKSVFHSLRILEYGLQIASHKHIKIYEVFSGHYETLELFSNNYERDELWDIINKTFKPRYNELHSHFKIFCPKKTSVQKKEDTIRQVLKKYFVSKEDLSIILNLLK